MIIYIERETGKKNTYSRANGKMLKYINPEKKYTNVLFVIVLFTQFFYLFPDKASYIKKVKRSFQVYQGQLSIGRRI